MGDKFKYYVVLQLVVLIAGFTGILGDLITIPAEQLTFFRMGISFISLLLIGFFVKRSKKISPKQFLKLMLTGGIVGLHWITFFYAIKVSTISIGVVCMSSAALFTSFLEPLFFKRKIKGSEMILGLFIVVGVLLIFGFESQYYIGILSGLASAFLAALFTVINGRLITAVSPLSITKIEMFGGFTVLFIILLFMGKVNVAMFYEPTLLDWVYLSILGLVCTTLAFLLSVWVMKYVTPFTVSMSLNMEPVYTILIALIIDSAMGTNNEVMTTGFYIGSLIIIGSIFMNAYLKKKSNQRRKAEIVATT